MLKYILIAILAIIYIIGIWTVKFLDDTLPDKWREDWFTHYMVLLIMWVMTPFTFLFFLFFIITKKL